jgi:hypothetical protein
VGLLAIHLSSLVHAGVRKLMVGRNGLGCILLHGLHGLSLPAGHVLHVLHSLLQLLAGSGGLGQLCVQAATLVLQHCSVQLVLLLLGLCCILLLN